MVNGVEIANYKSNDVVYYGPIKNISVTSEGDNYDVINPPILSVTDGVGAGVSGYCEVQGAIDKNWCCRWRIWLSYKTYFKNKWWKWIWVYC